MDNENMALADLHYILLTFGTLCVEMSSFCDVKFDVIVETGRQRWAKSLTEHEMLMSQKWGHPEIPNGQRERVKRASHTQREDTTSDIMQLNENWIRKERAQVLLNLCAYFINSKVHIVCCESSMRKKMNSRRRFYKKKTSVDLCKLWSFVVLFTLGNVFFSLHFIGDSVFFNFRKIERSRVPWMWAEIERFAMFFLLFSLRDTYCYWYERKLWVDLSEGKCPRQLLLLCLRLTWAPPIRWIRWWRQVSSHTNVRCCCCKRKGWCCRNITRRICLNIVVLRQNRRFEFSTKRKFNFSGKMENSFSENYNEKFSLSHISSVICCN